MTDLNFLNDSHNTRIMKLDTNYSNESLNFSESPRMSQINQSLPKYIDQPTPQNEDIGRDTALSHDHSHARTALKPTKKVEQRPGAHGNPLHDAKISNPYPEKHTMKIPSTNVLFPREPEVRKSAEIPSPAPQEGFSPPQNLGSNNPAAVYTKRPHRQHKRKTLEQVLALLQCTFRRFWRSKFSMILEISVPLIFALVLILLDIGFGTGDISARNYMNPSDLVSIYKNLYSYGICSNYSSGYPIETIDDCSKFVSSEVNCSGDESSLPVKGVCVLDFNPLGEVGYYINLWRGKPVAPPSLDDLVLHQWFAKKSGICSSASRIRLLSRLAVSVSRDSSTHIDSLCTSGYLYMAPARNVPQSLIDFITNRSGVFKYIYGGTFDTVEQAEQQLWKDDNPKPTWALIAINDLENGFDIDIQLNAKSLPALKPVVNPLYRGGYSFEGSDMYFMSGYITLQKLLYDYFITNQYSRGLITRDSPSNEIYPLITSFPDVKTERHYLVEITGTLVAFVIVLAFIYPFTQMTKRLVFDKELQIHETMLIMGVMRHSLWITFFIVSFLEYFLISILMTLILCMKVITLSNPIIVFIILFLYSCTLIPFAGLVSTLFTNCRMASLFAPMLYFTLAAVNFLINGVDETGILLLSFFSPTGMSNLLSSVLMRESGSGFTMSDFANPFFDAYLYKVIIIVVVDFLIYLLLMLYLDSVLPCGRSMPKHPLFFLSPIVKLFRRCFGCRGNNEEEEDDDDSDDFPCRPSLLDPNVGIKTKTGKPKKPIIQLKKVTKSYYHGKRRAVAVDNLSWVLYKGDISVLLGPNSSGKSTTVGIITGMTKPDKGDCIVDGHSVTKELDAVRANLGLCPQFNTLWPDLTCREHLELFAKIKGLKGEAVVNAIWNVLYAVDLVDKVNSLTSTLSGGQKRKLCVAIAFVGQNRVVILDEPTAGMDVSARRHIWSLLRAMSVNRTILLITHYMDETDILGDHVGILVNGKLQCAGSNLFLRSHSGFGYTLCLNLLLFNRRSKNQPSSSVINPEQEMVRLQETWSRLTDMIIDVISDVQCLSRTDRSILFRIPTGHETDIPKLLRYLEKIEKREIGLRSYTLVAPSMEDVFMNVLEASSENRYTNNAETQLHQDSHKLVSEESYAKPAEEQTEMLAMPFAASAKFPPAQNQDRSIRNVPMQTESVFEANSERRSEGLPTTDPFMSETSEVHVKISKNPERCDANALQSIWAIPKITSHFSLWYFQFKAVLYRRFLCFIRDYQMIAIQIFLPAFCVLIALSLGLINFKHTCSMELEPSMFRFPTEIQLANCLADFNNPDAAFFERMGHGAEDVSWTSTNFGTAREMMSYMQDSWYSHPRERYAAVHCNDPVLKLLMLAGTSVAYDVHLLMYNTSSRHSLPFTQFAWQRLWYLALLGRDGEGGGEAPVFRTRVTAVVPHGAGQWSKGTVKAILIGVTIVIPLTFMPSNPVKWIVREQHIRALHLQKVSGMHYVVFWLGNFVFDFVLYLVSVGLVMVVFAVCQEWKLVGSGRVGALIVVFLLYGLFCCFGAYAISFAFNEHTTAQVTVIGVGFLTGFIGVITVYVLSLLPRTEDASNKMRWAFRLIPTYAIGEVVINFKLSGLLDDSEFNPWGLDQTGWVNIYMASETVLCAIFIFLWDHPRRKHLVEAACSPFRFRRWRKAKRHSENEQQLPKSLNNTQSLPNGGNIDPTAFGEKPGVVRTASQGINRFPSDMQMLTELSYQAVSEGPYGANRLVNVIPITDAIASDLSHEHISMNALPSAHRVKSRRRIPPMYSASSLDSETEMENSDVELERLEVYREEKKKSNLEVVRLVDIRKKYEFNGKVAVRNLTFSVMPGEVFCFLGTNGAGKSTAMSILTQEILPTSGRAYICGHDIVRDGTRTLHSIGYCTQFDTCIDAMTVEEYIHFYALVHGIPQSNHKDLVQVLIEAFGLQLYRDVQSRFLSGGNRRKLSLALALIGAPEVVLLDEPSAGVDPIARRSIWMALNNVSKQCSIILTTHHLEEVEELGECVVIMVDGSLRCIGDLPHLKQKYGENLYELTIRVDDLNFDEARAINATPMREPTMNHSLGSPGSPSLCEQSHGIESGSVSSGSRKLLRRQSSIFYNKMAYLNNSNPILDFMQRYFPCALLLENVGDRQYTYSIPSNPSTAKKIERLKVKLGQTTNTIKSSGLGEGVSVSNLLPPLSSSVRHVSQLSDLFEILQQYKSVLRISNFSISHVSLENVFMRICSDDGNKKKNKTEESKMGEQVTGALSRRHSIQTICPPLYSRSQNLQSNRYGGKSFENYPHYRRLRAGLHFRVMDNTAPGT